MESLYNPWMRILTSITVVFVLSFPGEIGDAVGLPIPIAEPIEVVEVEEEVVYVDPREATCLQKNIYFEARNQGRRGMRAVAGVTMNRVDDPRFPDTVCGVVYQRRQFSWANNGDREPRLHNSIEIQAWATAGEIAEKALLGILDHEVGQAQYFHTTSINPGWRGITEVITINDHIFKHQPL